MDLLAAGALWSLMVTLTDDMEGGMSQYASERPVGTDVTSLTVHTDPAL